MKKIIILIALLNAFTPMIFAQKNIAQDERMEWWRDARFGMFIHWGLYAIPAGEWEGKEYPQIGEWIMKNARIPVAEYEKLAQQFNPVKFNAHDFVMTAKNAGMKYITITSKHHDGFAMFKSEASKYNIVDATPYGKDVIKALADECHKQELKLCFYYSQSRDWHEPNGLDNDWDFPKERDFQKYLDEKVKPQLTELLTNYGLVGMIWFDTPMTISEEQAQSLKNLVRSLQPACIISGRLGGGVETDYKSTGDNVIPAETVSGDWEVPATLNNTWGFKKNDHNWKSPEALTRLLFDIAAKGGNYLLNVGPTAEGVIPQASVDILAKVGKWMKTNSECIYGTKASPYKMEFKWGNITQKPGKLYLGIFNWPGSDFYLEGLKNKVKKVYLLSDKQQKVLPFKEYYNSDTDHHRLKIDLPEEAPDKVVSVVVIEIEGSASVETSICQQADKTILLSGILGEARKGNQPAELNFTARGGGANWLDTGINLTWNFKVENAGTFKVDLVTTETGSHGSPVWQGGQIIKISCAGQQSETIVTDDSREYNPRSQYWKLIHTSAGKIKFEEPGTYQLSLVPENFTENKIGFTFKEINLIPVR
ncbi:alpha-L-fucosidase [Maribellus comscasis]|uniref:alpha-L-fucosidase n=1 Tax=Maribellus comscasis TaxID=2681766 RepID=A0A6I6JQZ9_9BACT|nr:alpha-L-fucosidase [Maribellus comscasis]QGY42537.1 alpha-L-fucosidase [Maribellus comscasis]